MFLRSLLQVRRDYFRRINPPDFTHCSPRWCGPRRFISLLLALKSLIRWAVSPICHILSAPAVRLSDLTPARTIRRRRRRLALFLTNYLAILLAGGVFLVILGLGKMAGTQEHGRFRRRGLALFVVGILLVTRSAHLIYQFKQFTRTLANHNATAEVQQWLEGTSYQVVACERE